MIHILIGIPLDPKTVAGRQSNRQTDRFAQSPPSESLINFRIDFETNRYENLVIIVC